MKIALIGYGKMGHMIEQIALERGHEIVCKIDKITKKISILLLLLLLMWQLNLQIRQQLMGII